MFMMIILMILMSLIFIQLNNPLSMGLMLFMQTIMVCLMTGTMSKSFWFSYILFLVFLGGMLILFMYIISLASNEMFSIISKWTILMTLLLSTMIMMEKSNLFDNFTNLEMIPLTIKQSMLNENSINLSKLYNFPTNFINILLMIYLLITLVVSVKITKMNQGPLRKLN